ncbi:hypothetical protein L202_05270 [Cryptococcus amylolentus CBS 6039]|uniref:Uncharacterized protein n=2 Tax=Cryptococcus amylolentus TaxID=104669 RepID=A0A1E3HJV5_9TREE|nr:hypothetical protein L202_05270 [Cryptococcus amylolentus CBS 6039]ODN76622.1 hypothetical protein L202_05270 [Cryptococcus amylolentus CBS 6039]ODO04593.1 hypothetical protein I350_05199 [Cryptococcus amylolentus CBS 6273]
MLRLAQMDGKLVLLGLPSSLSQALGMVSPAPRAASVFSDALLGGEQGVQMLHYLRKSEVDEPGEEVVERMCRTWDDVGSDAVRLDEKAREYDLEVEQYIEAAQTNPTFLVENYHRAVKSYDLMVNIRMVEAVVNIEKTLQLVAKGKSNAMVIEKRKSKVDSREIRGLSDSVEEASAHKAKGNTAGKASKYEAAIKHYLAGLVALWPWTANSSMSYGTATTTGLAQIEQALLGNISIIALKTPPKTGPKRAAWDEIAKIACELVLMMRYIPNGTIMKAAERLAQIETRTKRDGRMPNGAWQELVNVVKDKPSDHWAHRQCYTSHDCCDYD